MVLAVVVLAASASLPAQTLKKVGEFGTYKGDIQFLPGAHVLTVEDGQVVHYVYRRGKFREEKAPLPALLRGWKSFDWGTLDPLDQLDRQDFESEIDDFLPAGRKVKTLTRVPLGKGKSLILVCYMLKTTEEFPGSSDTDIFLVGAERTRFREGPDSYRELWQMKLRTGTTYGGLIYQEVPAVGRFVLLYSMGVGGSGFSLALDVYRIVP